MRAAVYHGPRDVRVEQVAEPGDPRSDQVKLRVRRVALCGTDAGEFAHGPIMVPLHMPHPASGHVGPVVLGHEIVGDVVAVGGAVERISVGDRVVPGAGMWCGDCRWCQEGRTNLCSSYYTLGLNADGGLTALLNVPDRMCRIVPAGCALDAAAMAQPMAVALHAVARSGVGPDDGVVLIGVGGIGLFVLAGLLDTAGRVVAVDVDPAKLETARRLGVHAAIDARAQDAEAQVRDALGGEPVDIVFEASGAARSPSFAQRLVRRGGRLMLIGLQADARPMDLTDLVLREVDIITSVAHVCGDDLPRSLALLSGGPLAGEALDRLVTLDAIVSDGLEALVRGEVAGKVVVDLDGEL
jgi:(R,R)-butanediol dehydrogenase / meso-butanediol dehydrogenase / diacetyl reductase